MAFSDLSRDRDRVSRPVRETRTDMTLPNWLVSDDLLKGVYLMLFGICLFSGLAIVLVAMLGFMDVIFGRDESGDSLRAAIFYTVLCNICVGAILMFATPRAEPKRWRESGPVVPRMPRTGPLTEKERREAQVRRQALARMDRTVDRHLTEKRWRQVAYASDTGSPLPDPYAGTGRTPQGSFGIAAHVAAVREEKKKRKRSA